MKKRGLWFVLGLIAAALVVFLFLPGGKSKRITQVDRTIQSLLKTGRKLTASEFDTLKKAKALRVRENDYRKSPDVYLFMPSPNINIALLAREGYPSLADYHLNVFPLADPESPTSEHALSLCLTGSSRWSINQLMKASANILPDAPKIEGAWKALDQLQRDEIAKQLSANFELRKSLGGFNVIVVKNGFAYGMTEWRVASDICGEVSQLD